MNPARPHPIVLLAASAAILAACSNSTSDSSTSPRVAFAEPRVSALDPSSLATTTNTRSLVLGDVDGDGRIDALVGHDDAATRAFGTVVYLANADGSFRQGAVVDGLRGAAVTDLNRDGKPDIVGCGANGLRILMGTGDGATFSEIPVVSILDCGRAAVGDYDGDGIPDVATKFGPSGDAQRFIVWRGRGDGRVEILHGETLLEGIGAAATWDLLPANVNGDARTDLVVRWRNSAQEPYRFRVLASQADGSFAKAWPTGADPAELAGRSAEALFTADLDLDGRADAFAWASGAGVAPLGFTLLGRADGTFSAAVGTRDLAAAPVAIGDLDGDLKPDLLFWTTAAGQPPHLDVALGTGNGDFGIVFTVASPAGDFSGLTAVGDVDHDGGADVVVLTGTGLVTFLGR